MTWVIAFVVGLWVGAALMAAVQMAKQAGGDDKD